MKTKIFAVVALLAVIVCSAFTLNSNTSKKTTEDPLYWYYVDEYGNLSTAVSGSQITKTVAMETVPCEDQIEPDCARGYTTPQSGYGLPAPAVSNDDEHIQHTN